MANAPGTSLGPPIWAIPIITAVSNANPSAPGITTVNVLTLLPKGVVAIEGRLVANSLTAGQYVAIREHDGVVDLDVCRVPVVGLYADQHYLVRLNAAGEFDYNSSHADIQNVYIYIHAYYMGG